MLMIGLPMIAQSKKYQAGISLVELMIAITLGLILLAGITAIAVSNIRTNDDLERANQQIENGRYAMSLIVDDLKNAGYFAEFNPGVLTAPTTKPDPCAVTLAELNAAMPIPIQGYENGTGAPTCLSDVKANSDIFVVRRVSTCAVGDVGCDAALANAPYFQASSCSNTTELASTSGNYSSAFYALDTVTTNLVRHRKDCTTVAPIRKYVTRIYFIANNDKSSDGIPTLKRAELGNSASPGGFTIVSLVQGIDNIQVEYGLDNPTSPTGAPAVFTSNPDSYNSCSSSTNPTCMDYWRNTVAVKVHLLARNITATTGYSSTKTYYMGLDASGNSNIAGAFSDAFKRHLYESTVRINNVAGRNTP